MGQISLKSWFVLLTAVLWFAGCAPKSPEEVVVENRAKYEVILNAFLPQTPPAPPAAEAAGEAAGSAEGVMAAVAAEAAAEGEATDEEMEAEETGPSSTNVLFDLIVRFDGTQSLPGLTVEVSHADPSEQEKGSFRHWLELPSMVKSQTEQISFEIPIENFEDGDLFSVELRSFVPPEERGEYREFAGL